jgi:Mrp family chromosome partitioning ATPase/capsular polysaccharide biosynthesis protein
MNSFTGQAVRDLADYGAILRRRWWVIALALVIGAGGAFGYLRSVHKVYSSTATVLVTATGADDLTRVASGRTAGSVNLDTEAQVIRSSAVADAARDLLKSSSPTATLVRAISVRVPPNSSVVQISYKGSSPAAAQQGAQAFAQAYLSARSASASAALEAEIQALQKQLSESNAELQAVTSKVASLDPSSPERAFAVAQQSVLVTKISSINSQLGPLLATKISPGQIITPAILPERSSSPSRSLVGPSGVMLGLLLGVGLAVLLERFDPRVWRSADVARLAGLGVLAEIPLGRRRVTSALLSPERRGGRAVRRLRNALLMGSQRGQVIVVAGTSRGPGCGVVAANLAASLSRGGASVALVCSDFTSRVSTGVLGLESAPGLAEVLVSGASLETVEQRPIKTPGLRVVPPGADAARAAELLGIDAVKRILAELRMAVDYVIVEAPAPGRDLDLQLVTPLADLAMVVIELRRSRPDRVRQAVTRIEASGVPLAGAVVVPRRHMTLRRVLDTHLARPASAREAKVPGHPVTGFMPDAPVER